MHSRDQWSRVMNMLSVDEALRLVLDHARPLAPQIVRQVQALGRTLAGTVVSDVDSPPHDKSIVDGFAVRSLDFASSGGAVLRIIEDVPAGAIPMQTVQPGQATRIMTGAPLPAGADAVVMVEQTADLGDERVRIDASTVRAGQNIMRRAASLAKGQTVLEPGRVLRGIELGLLAEVGCDQVPIIPEPQVFIIATGNELVGFWEQPGPGQIRNSNSLLLFGLATQAGGFPVMKGIARDNEDELREKISSVIFAPIIILSGGVSAGKFDLVPKILVELGVEQVFHKVNLKPGKPLWFGVKEHQEIGRQTLVFGLPGNPVSTLVCFELFVRPAIEKLSGREPKGLPRTTAVLARDHQQRGERPTYWPAVVRNVDPPLIPSFSHELQTPLHSIIGFAEVLQSIDTLNDKQKRYVENILRSGRDLQQMIGDVLQLALVYGQTPPPERETLSLLPWQGSGDLRTLTDANCLAHFPAGDRLFRAGDVVEVLLLPEP